MVEDYVSAIDGFSYDEESQELKSSNENIVAGKAAIGVAFGNGSHTGRQTEGIKRSVESTMQQNSIRSINFFNLTKMMGLSIMNSSRNLITTAYIVMIFLR